MFRFIIVFCLSILSINCLAQELVIGNERIEPGIRVIFEGAIKDTVYPESLHLAESNTQVHIEARVNWDDSNVPKGAIIGGFIPYMNLTCKVINQNTKHITFIDLLPHINLIDNFHYARNIYLPGNANDLYTVIFTVHSPQIRDLSLHKDWVNIYGKQLFESTQYSYENINFDTIVKSKRPNK